MESIILIWLAYLSPKIKRRLKKSANSDNPLYEYMEFILSATYHVKIIQSITEHYRKYLEVIWKHY